jgi:Ca2+-binding RTX toxin-like protein
MRRLLGCGIAVVTLCVPVGPAGPASAAQSSPRPTCQGRPATIVGTTHKTYGTPHDDVIVTTLPTGINTVYAGAGDDLVCDSDANSAVFDGPGNDRIYGNGGEDGVFQESVDRDFFDGGPGFDAVVYQGRTADMYVNLRDDKADDGQAGEHDRLLSVASVTTGSGNDVLVAGTRRNVDGGGRRTFDYYLISLGGDDRLIGGPRKDLLFPGAGADVVFGKRGADFIRASDAISGYGATVGEPDRIDGGADDDAEEIECAAADDLVTRVSVFDGC